MSSATIKKPLLIRQKDNAIHDHVCHLAKVSYLSPIVKDGFTFPAWEHSDIFGNTHPVKVEYCSGNGAWIASRAAADPSVNWVAVEMRFGRTRKIWSKIKKLNLKNLFIVNGEAEHATQTYFPKNSVDEIYINFPDPWPKRYHAKNRLIKPEFVQAMASLLKEKGSITFVTDDEAYSEWTLKIFRDSPYFTNSFPEPHYITEWPNYGNSYFEDLWREKGCTIRYHQFTKIATPTEKPKQKTPLTITLDATQKSTLNWEEAIIKAENAIAKGSCILWNLDLGLFDQLSNPLSNPQQFLTLSLAIKHFSESIWSKFAEESVGVCLFRGSFDLTRAISKENTNNLQAWIQDRFTSPEAFCHETQMKIHSFEDVNPTYLTGHPEGTVLLSYFYRDVALDYLKQLAGQLPYGAEPFIELEVSETLSSIEKHIYLNEECYKPLNLLNYLKMPENCNLGICLPPITAYSPRSNHLLDQAIRQLDEQGLSYRIIAEEALITSLEGLDELFVSSLSLSSQGKRQIQGFCAAGGMVNYL